MPTPNSGPTEVDLSSNLGDTSKLEFLNEVKLDDSAVTTEKAADNVTPIDGEDDADDTAAADPTVDDNTEATTTDDAADDTADDAQSAAQSAAVTATGAVSATKGVRNYKDIAPEDVDVFKQMSDKAYARAVEWYNKSRAQAAADEATAKELNELREYKFYQHPDGYKFTADYAKAAKEFRDNSAIVNHYEKCLEQLEAGQPIRDIGYDDKGNLILLSDEIQPTPALKAQVSVALQKALTSRSKVEESLESLSTKYQTRHKEFETVLEKGVNGLVSKELQEDPSYKPLYEKWLKNVVPETLQNVPVYKQLARMGAFVQLATATISRIQKQQATAGIKKAALKAQGPGDGQPASGSADWRQQSIDDVAKQFDSLRFG